jgi:hypothetical protein
MKREYHMIDPKAISDAGRDIERRNFVVLFYCEECTYSEEVVANTIYLKYGSPEKEITDYLMRFHPFCCFNCGADDFGIHYWTEKK